MYVFKKPHQIILMRFCFTENRNFNNNISYIFEKINNMGNTIIYILVGLFISLIVFYFVIKYAIQNAIYQFEIEKNNQLSKIEYELKRNNELLSKLNEKNN